MFRGPRSDRADLSLYGNSEYPNAPRLSSSGDEEEGPQYNPEPPSADQVLVTPELLVITNPICGNRTGLQFVESNVLPLLDQAGISYEHRVTTAAWDAGIFAREHHEKTRPRREAIPILVAGGDGTLHEVINSLFHPDASGRLASILEIVLVPTGTANALYSSLFSSRISGDESDLENKLFSLRSFLNSRQSKHSSKTPLSLQFTSIVTPSGETATSIISSVVTSSALHASILDTAEKLREREDLPGVERFKAAAQENIENWYYSEVTLTGVRGRYNPGTKVFEKPENTSTDLTLEGPFEYFLSTANVDRLEPHFQITPLHSRIPRQDQDSTHVMDLLVVRPSRHPNFTPSLIDSPENRKAFVSTSMAVLMGAYKQGEHVDLRYHSTWNDADKPPVSVGGDGESVVEYYRCSGWEWKPEPNDPQAVLICADGVIMRIEPGGKARCEMLTAERLDPGGVVVWS